MMFSILNYCHFCDSKALLTTPASDSADTSVIYHHYGPSVLDSLRSVLVDLKQHYHYNDVFPWFGVKGNKPLGFFVYDLTDTLNNSNNGEIKFREGHIYHFAPTDLYFSYSNICILSKGKLYYFRALNCKKI